MTKVKHFFRFRVKKWLGILDIENKQVKMAESLACQGIMLDNKIKELDKLTREDWDLGLRGPSTIILTGVYRGKGYVKFYDVPTDEFIYLVEMFHSQRKKHLIRNIDMPYTMQGTFTL